MFLSYLHSSVLSFSLSWAGLLSYFFIFSRQSECCNWFVSVVSLRLGLKSDHWIVDSSSAALVNKSVTQPAEGDWITPTLEMEVMFNKKKCCSSVSYAEFPVSLWPARSRTIFSDFLLWTLLARISSTGGFELIWQFFYVCDSKCSCCEDKKGTGGRGDRQRRGKVEKEGDCERNASLLKYRIVSVCVCVVSLLEQGSHLLFIRLWREESVVSSPYFSASSQAVCGDCCGYGARPSASLRCLSFPFQAFVVCSPLTQF